VLYVHFLPWRADLTIYGTCCTGFISAKVTLSADQHYTDSPSGGKQVHWRPSSIPRALQQVIHNEAGSDAQSLLQQAVDSLECALMQHSLTNAVLHALTWR
jgi:hypothetical protein